MSLFLGVFPLFKPIVIGFYKLIYGIWFGIIYAIAWVLDMLTQLFFVFAGMTPVNGNVNGTDGTVERVDIVNFFLTQDKFQKTYLQLCLIALALIVAFTIGRIIKQDYFDRAGPRSKGPIFRNVALSFIAFICIIPVFYFLVSATGALALAVMKAMGYQGGGVGTMLFNMSWSDGGASFIKVGEEISTSSVYDANSFGWYPGDTYFYFKVDEKSAELWNTDPQVLTGDTSFFAKYGILAGQFYWYIFLFGGLVVIIHLGKMMLAMLTRMYNLIALFIVAPSPISQIVLDEGQKFKSWKDKVVQESVKVIGCVMSFMLFIMIITSVNNLDLMMFVNTEYSASAVSLIDGNGLTSELSNINLLYYNGAEISNFDIALNALGKTLIIVAGAGAISDIDSTITPFLAGGSSSADLGNAGKHIATVTGKVASGAMQIAGGLAGLAAGGVAGAFGKRSLAKRQARSEMEDALNKSDEKAQKDDATTPTNNNTPTPGGGGSTGPGSTGLGSGGGEGASTPTEGVGAPRRTEETETEGSEGAETPERVEGTEIPEGAEGAEIPEGAEGAEIPEGVEGTEVPEGTEGAEIPEGAEGTEAPEGAEGAEIPEGAEGTEASEGAEGAETAEGVEGTEVPKGTETAETEDDDKASETNNADTHANNSKNEKQGTKPVDINSKKASKRKKKIAKKYGRAQGRKAFWKSVGLGVAKTAGGTALKLAGLAATTMFHSVGMGALSDGFANGFKDGLKKNKDKRADVKKEASKYKDNSKKEASKKEKLSNAAVEYQNWKTTQGDMDAIKNANNELKDNSDLMTADGIEEVASPMIAAAANLENCAEVANENAGEAGALYVDPELTYSGDIETEQEYDYAVNEDNAAGEQLQNSQKAYDDAKAKLDQTSSDDAGYEQVLTTYNNASTKLEQDKETKRLTEESLSEVSGRREEIASNNKTIMYNHVKAREELQNAVSYAKSSEAQNNDSANASQRVTTASVNLASASKALTKRINGTNRTAGSVLDKKQSLNAESTRPVSSGVRAESTYNSGIKKDARMGEFTDDVSKTDVDRKIAGAIGAGDSLETKARQTNAASKSLGMAQDADLTYSGDLDVENKYNEVNSTVEKYQAEYDDANEKFAGMNETDDGYEEAKQNVNTASRKLNKAQRDRDVVVEVRERQAKKNKTTMYRYTKAKEGLQNANNELQSMPDDSSPQNIRVRIKINKANAAYAAASSELSQKVDSNDAENLRTSVLAPTRQRKMTSRAMSVEIIGKLDSDKTTGAPSIGGKFSEVAYCALASDMRKKDTKARMTRALNDIPDECELSFADGELEKAIRSIDASRASERMEARGISSTSEYASDLKARYEAASDSYKTNINRAKVAMQSYNVSKDPQMLKQVRDAVAAAYADSDEINDIKVELKNVSND